MFKQNLLHIVSYNELILDQLLIEYFWKKETIFRYAIQNVLPIGTVNEICVHICLKMLPQNSRIIVFQDTAAVML